MLNPLTYIRALLHGWWILLAALCLSTGAGLAYSYSQQPVYKAETTFIANPSLNAGSTGELLDRIDTLARRTGLVTNYCEILRSALIIDQAVAILNVPASAINPYDVSCVVLPDASILQLKVKGPSPSSPPTWQTPLARRPQLPHQPLRHLRTAPARSRHSRLLSRLPQPHHRPHPVPRPRTRWRHRPHRPTTSPARLLPLTRHRGNPPCVTVRSRSSLLRR